MLILKNLEYNQRHELFKTLFNTKRGQLVRHLQIPQGKIHSTLHSRNWPSL